MSAANQLVRISYQGRELEVSVLIEARAGEWVVALHGIQSNKEQWAKLFDQEFLANYSLLAISFVGFGDSSKPKDFAYDLQAQGEVVKLVLEKLKVERFHLIGHSLGGMVGTLLLEELGSRILSFSNLEGNLVLADCGASKDVVQSPQDEFERVGYRQLKDKVRQSSEKSAKARSQWLESTPAFVFYNTSVSIVEWSRSEKLLGLFNNSSIRRLFIYGDQNVRKGLLVLDDVEKVEIPGAGHFMLLDNPEACYLALSEFIAKK